MISGRYAAGALGVATAGGTPFSGGLLAVHPSTPRDTPRVIRLYVRSSKTHQKCSAGKCNCLLLFIYYYFD